MGYLTPDEIKKIGFKSIGKGVKISDKASIYDAEKIEIGDHSRIDDFTIVSGNVKIGKYVHITPFCVLAGGQSGITLDDYSGLAYNVSIFSQSDDYSGTTMTNPLIPAKFKKEIKEAVYIGKHVIIGAGSCVMPGVHIEEGCSVGAMTLMNKSTEPWGMYIGIPARRFKERSQNILNLEKQFLSEIEDV